MAKGNSVKPLSGGCLSLFGLPFLAAGFFLSWLYFSGFSQWLGARAWDEVPCWIESADLKVSRGDDSDTYKTIARYRYVYQGRTWRGERVSFHQGGDNVGDFQQRAYRELRSYVGEKPAGAELDPGRDLRPFRCYVNPENPDESVLYRTLRWEMQAFMAMFALTFPAVGAGLVVGGVMSLLASRREAALRERHPGEPWKWRPEWAGSSIAEKAVAWRVALHGYTIWSGLIVFTLVAGAAMSGAFEAGGTVWLLMVFVGVWMVPAWFSIQRIRHRMAVGTTRFELAELPAWPGGLMKGAILMRRPPPMRLPVEVELICEKSLTRRSGDGDSTTTEKLWSQRGNVLPDAVSRDLSGFRLPVSFALPADSPESGPGVEEGVKHTWKLHFKVPGSAIDSVFEVPVFRTEKSPDLSAGLVSGAPSMLDEASADLASLLAARRIKADFDGAGAPIALVCPPARNRLLIVFLIVFDVIWTAAAVFLIKQQAPLIFRIVWPVSAAGIWVGVIWSLLHQRRVTFGPLGLELRNQVGPVIWTQGFEKAGIVGFSHDSNMTSGNQRFYRVRLESVLGKKPTLVDGITESNTAAMLVKRLEAWRKT